MKDMRHSSDHLLAIGSLFQKQKRKHELEPKQRPVQKLGQPATSSHPSPTRSKRNRNATDGKRMRTEESGRMGRLAPSIIMNSSHESYKLKTMAVT